jgi:hypothetical protein
MRGIYRLLIIVIGGIAGVVLPTSCAYGTEGNFQLNGRVHDAADQGIDRLRIEVWQEAGGCALHDAPATLYSQYDGTFGLWHDVCLDQELILEVHDDDGAENGGPFASQKIVLPPADLADGEEEVDIEMTLE